MARDRLQTRCDPDTIEEVETYADEKEISQSEAVRRLIRTGLVAKGYRDAETGDYAEAHYSPTAATVGGVLILLALLYVLIQFIL